MKDWLFLGVGSPSPVGQTRERSEEPREGDRATQRGSAAEWLRPLGEGDRG